MKKLLQPGVSLGSAALLCCLLAGCGGVACDATGEVPALLDVTLPMGPEGVAFPFTLNAPTSVDVRVDLPNMMQGQAAIGPLYAAMRPHLVYEPDATEDEVFAVKGSPGAWHRVELKKAGMYAVRIASIPTAMGEMTPMIHVVVKARSVDEGSSPSECTAK